MIDTFRIGAYWGSRPEILNDVISRTLKTFDQLIEIDKQFTNWYEGANSRKEALQKKVIINAEAIERLYKESIKKGELDEKGYCYSGFSIGLWSGHSDHESSSISIYAGGKFDTENIKHCCIISFPFKGLAHTRLLQLNNIKNIINILVTNWDPDNIILNSKQLSNTFEDINKIGWVTYVKKINRVLKLSQNIIHEKFHEGHLFYLKTDHIPDYAMMNELQEMKILY